MMLWLQTRVQCFTRLMITFIVLNLVGDAANLLI